MRVSIIILFFIKGLRSDNDVVNAQVNCFYGTRVMCPLYDDLQGRRYDAMVAGVMPDYYPGRTFLRVRYADADWKCKGGTQLSQQAIGGADFEKCDVPIEHCEVHRSTVFAKYGEYRFESCHSKEYGVERPPSTHYTDSESLQVIAELERQVGDNHEEYDVGTIILIIALAIAGVGFITVLILVFRKQGNAVWTYKDRSVPGGIEWYRVASWADNPAGRSLAKLYQQALRRERGADQVNHPKPEINPKWRNKSSSCEIIMKTIN